MSNSASASAPLVQSVDRAVPVLEILAQRGQAGVTEIAAELGVHKSTASRLVAALVATVGETVNIAVLADDWAVNICQVRGPAAVASHNWVGQRTPLHATSSGKAPLAAQPAEVAHALGP